MPGWDGTKPLAHRSIANLQCQYTDGKYGVFVVIQTLEMTASFSPRGLRKVRLDALNFIQFPKRFYGERTPDEERNDVPTIVVPDLTLDYASTDASIAAVLDPEILEKPFMIPPASPIDAVRLGFEQLSGRKTPPAVNQTPKLLTDRLPSSVNGDAIKAHIKPHTDAYRWRFFEENQVRIEAAFKQAQDSEYSLCTWNLAKMASRVVNRYVGSCVTVTLEDVAKMPYKI